MPSHRLGYISVSSFDQHPDRQLEQVPVDRVFTDKASGKDVHRPALEALLAAVRDGDTVVVHSMDRLARNLVTCAASCTASPSAACASSSSRKA